MLIYENGHFRSAAAAKAEAERLRRIANEIDCFVADRPTEKEYLATLENWRFDTLFGSGVAGRVSSGRPALFPGLVILDCDAGAVLTDRGWVRLAPYSRAPLPETDVEALMADDGLEFDDLHP